MASRWRAWGAPFAAIRNSWSERGAHDAEVGGVAGAFEVRGLSVGQLGKDLVFVTGVAVGTDAPPPH